MNCRFYGCKDRATKYLLNRSKRLGRNIVSNARAHPYCAHHWDRVYRRYWW